MKKANLKKITILLLISFLTIFFSCSKKQENSNILRMNISSEPDSFSPWKSSAADTKAILFNIFEGLTTFDPTGKITPCIAENYQVSDDGLTYTFNIRKDVYFHNGKQLTGKDVLYTYQNLAGLNGLSPTSDEMQIIKNAYLENDFCFKVELKKSTASFLTFAIQPILQKDYLENESKPIGTGPYKFKEYTIHQKVVLEKNDSYWNKEKMPKIPTIELYIISDESSLIYALQSNQLDIAQLLTGGNAKTLENQFDLISYPQNMVQIFAMNNKIKPFDNQKVRKAISLAINKKEIIDGALNGFATELYSNFSPVLKNYYNDELKNINEFNIKEAKKLLTQANYPNGFELTITVPSNYTAHIDTAQIIITQLEKIGIKCKVNTIEWATWLTDVYSNKDFETTVIAFGGKLEPNEILKRYTSTYKRNFVGFSNEQFDKCFSDALIELNEEKRINLYKECQKILAEENPCVFISDPNNCVLKKKNVKGFTYYPISFYDLSSLYFE